MTSESTAKRFALIYTGRTGSNFLVSLLDSHPEILCHHELFNKDGIHISIAHEDQTSIDFGSLQYRNRHPLNFLNRVFKTSLGSRAVGFKISHESLRVLLYVLLNRRIKKILVYRENILDAYISKLLARSTGIWILKEKKLEGTPPEGDAPPSVRVDSAEFIRYTWKIRIFYRGARTLMRLTGQSWMDVEYSQIGDPARMTAVTEFIGVAGGRPLKAGTKRQNPATQREKVSNYDDLRARLGNTKYARYLTG